VLKKPRTMLEKGFAVGCTFSGLKPMQREKWGTGWGRLDAELWREGGIQQVLRKGLEATVVSGGEGALGATRSGGSRWKSDTRVAREQGRAPTGSGSESLARGRA
jgi:hypothetical protein